MSGISAAERVSGVWARLPNTVDPPEWRRAGSDATSGRRTNPRRVNGGFPASEPIAPALALHPLTSRPGLLGSARSPPRVAINADGGTSRHAAAGERTTDGGV